MDAEQDTVPGGCPVCATSFGGAVRRCPRCETPHHEECWEYVPGCAVFGCAATGTPRLEEWPRVVRLVLARAATLALGARLLRGGLAALLLGPLVAPALHLLSPAALPLAAGLAGLGGILLLLGASCGLVALLQTRRLRKREDYRNLAELASGGSDRVRRAIHARCGSPGSFPPWEIALSLGLLYAALRNAVGVTMGGPFDVDFLLGNLAAALPLAALVFFPVLKIAAEMVGSQRVLARRFEVSRVEKEAPES